VAKLADEGQLEAVLGQPHQQLTGLLLRLLIATSAGEVQRSP